MAEQAALSRDALGFSLTMCRAVEELGEALGSRPEPFTVPPTGDGVLGRLAWAASACDTVRDAAPLFGQVSFVRRLLFCMPLLM